MHLQIPGNARESKGMAGRIALSVFLLAVVLVASLTCSGRRLQSEAELVEAELTKPLVGELERSVKQGVSTSGRDIQTVTLVFLIDDPVFEYRDHVNAFLLDRGYAQARNISTPTEFSIAYDGLDGLIRVEVMAEVALPPASSLTGLPEPEGGLPPPDTSRDQGVDDGEEPSPPALDYHRVTIKINY